MSISSTPVFRKRFGMFVPCDLPTYRQLKRIRHLLTFADAMARRWSRAQRRLPKNRWFWRGRQRRVVSDVMLFAPFWLPGTVACSTDARELFLRDYHNARFPKASAEAVVPSELRADEVASLLEHLEQWHREVFVPW